MTVLGTSLVGKVPFKLNFGAEESERGAWKFGRCDAFPGCQKLEQVAFPLGELGTFAIPTLLAKLGPAPSLRLPLLGVLARRPLPKISCASASFLRRKRSVMLSHEHLGGGLLAMLTGLYDVVERHGLSVCCHN